MTFTTMFLSTVVACAFMTFCVYGIAKFIERKRD